jgi:uncharacterized Zn-finger protein
LGIIAAPARSTRATLEQPGDAAMASNAPAPPETIEVETMTVACDGGGGALGHPKVFLTLEKGQVECSYCDRLFKLKPGARTGGH